MSTEKTTPTTADSSGKIEITVITENIPSITAVSQIPLNQLAEFKYHAFKTYTGERLEQLTESIRANGLIHPITVRRMNGGDKFEIISGHNRVEAARAAGVIEIPAIIRDLTDDEAIIMANEANIVQRGFKTWLPSEKAASIYQYHAAIKRQGSRPPDTSGGTPQKRVDAREKTARAYGITPNAVRLHLELHRLDPNLMERLDCQEFGVSAAQNLSAIPKEVQRVVEGILSEDQAKKQYAVTVLNSKEIKDEFQGYDSNESQVKRESEIKRSIRRLLDNSSYIPAEPSFIGINFPTVEYRLLFGTSSAEDVIDVIIEAVRHYNSSDPFVESQIEGTPGEMGENTQANAS